MLWSTALYLEPWVFASGFHMQLVVHDVALKAFCLPPAQG